MRDKIVETKLLDLVMRLDTVVIGMDFSRAGVAAADWAAKVVAPRARIALVHAIEPHQRPSFLVADTFPSEALEIDGRTEAEDELRRVALVLGPNVTRAEVRVGHAAEVINQFAIDAGADLIVVGPHGARRHQSPLLGTTADTLVRGATIPVLVGARGVTGGKTRVIAGVTEGSLRRTILAWGEMMAGRLGGRLTLIHAIELTAYSHMASLVAAHAHGDETAERREIGAALERDAQQWLAESVRSGADANRIDPIVEPGAAAELILAHAAKERAALIVLGRHEGRSFGLPRLGRTVRHVLHDARCAVLVVPPM